MAKVRFTIPDGSGRPHEWAVPWDDPMDDLRTGEMILALLSGPLSALAEAMVGGDAAGSILEADIDLKAAGDHLGKQLRTGALSALYPRLLAGSTRDGDQVFDASGKTTAAGKVAFRGNLPELHRAAWEVVKGKGLAELAPTLAAFGLDLGEVSRLSSPGGLQGFASSATGSGDTVSIL